MKKYLLVIIGILLILSIMLGTSYAYWSLTHKQTNENLVNSGCFATTFTEVKDSNINLTNSYPMTDEDGMKTKPYEFTITNTCDTYASYNINMEVLNTTTLSHELIKAVLDNGTPKVVTEYTSTTATIEEATSYTLLSGGLDTDESKTFNFRMWVDEAGTVDNAQNKVVNAKIVVVTTAAERIPKLTELLLAQYQEGNEVGLVKDVINPDLYYFKGTNTEVANNFLWYGGHQWRVLEFDNDKKTITLITQQPLTAIQPASEPWDSEQEYNDSYINQWLNEYFWNSLDENIQNNILDSTFNVGIYGETEAEQNVSEVTTTKKVGLLDAEQYIRTGEADSFLNIGDYCWLGNRYSTSHVRYMSFDGVLYSSRPSNGHGVRAVIKITDVAITGGDGTLVDNYRTGAKATNTSDIQVGEYINVPYNGVDKVCGEDNQCTMRVVSKDSDSIKVVLNGLLPITSYYGSTASITVNHTIYTPLNTFASGIIDTYRYAGTPKIFHIGKYLDGRSGEDYKNVLDSEEILTANVGLPTVSEMFSGNDIDLSTSSTKTFVDVNTIENPTVSDIYWTMNRSDISHVRCVSNSGVLSYNGLSGNGRGVRAVLYLKAGPSALTFTGGEGTPQNPYTLD